MSSLLLVAALAVSAETVMELSHSSTNPTSAGDQEAHDRAADQSQDNAVDLSKSTNVTQGCEARMAWRKTRTRVSSCASTSLSEGMSPTGLVFEAYVTREARKLANRPGMFAQYYHHFQSYKEALIALDSQSEKALANVAIAIGDCSAMMFLKQAIEGFRSPVVSGSRYIAQEMSFEFRLEIIHRLDLHMAHLRLARWLHIYKLYDDLCYDVCPKDEGGFVVLTSADLANSMDRVARPRGNPRNLERAFIAKRMAGRSDIKETQSQKKTKAFPGRLRRLGQRLQTLVHRWGIGVLCLLGAGVTDDL